MSAAGALALGAASTIGLLYLRKQQAGSSPQPVAPAADRACPAYVLKPLPAADVPKTFAMEIASYPADEAASQEGMAFRQQAAPAYFWAAYSPEAQILGFVVGTCCAGSTLEVPYMCGACWFLHIESRIADTLLGALGHCLSTGRPQPTDSLPVRCRRKPCRNTIPPGARCASTRCALQ